MAAFMALGGESFHFLSNETLCDVGGATLVSFSIIVANRYLDIT